MLFIETAAGAYFRELISLRAACFTACCVQAETHAPTPLAIVYIYLYIFFQHFPNVQLPATLFPAFK